MTDIAIPIHSARVRGMVPGHGPAQVELQLSPTRSFQEITVSIPIELARSLALDLLQTAITTQVVQSVQHGGIQEVAGHHQSPSPAPAAGLTEREVEIIKADDQVSRIPPIPERPLLPDHLRTDRSPL